MKRERLSLHIRIFLSMMPIILIATVLIIGVIIIQNNEQSEEYHIHRLARKEGAIKRDIEHQLKNTTWHVEAKNLKHIFRDEIFVIANIHGMEINLYDFNGKLLITSKASFVKEPKPKLIPKIVLDELEQAVNNHRIVVETKKNEITFKKSYSYIYDNKSNPVAILSIPYVEESKFFQNELNEFIRRITYVFILVFLLSIFVTYFTSRYITHSIKTVVDKMNKTRLNQRNQKIDLEGGSTEIYDLVSAYNSMIDKLEESAVKLAQSEREQAWREMAKQVAHEIKNPLTPMRLTIQSFQRGFDPDHSPSKEEINEFSQSLLMQIDTMTSIASAFSDFAKMPKGHKAPLDIVSITKQAVDIFPESYIVFFSEVESCIVELDKTQYIRVITNLVTNAKQALDNQSEPRIEVSIKVEKDRAFISVADNGKGIAKEVQDRIFEPKFTTKTSGMGLGLPMVKNIIETYDGQISFVSAEGTGTVFTIVFPVKV